MVNPLMQFMQMFRNGGNPQQMLLTLAQNNDGKGIEQIARNLCAQRGLDFDKEFATFKQQLGL